MAFIAENNPDLLVTLGEKGIIKSYVSDKVTLAMDFAKNLKKQNLPDSEIMDACREKMVEDLIPSKFQFLKNLIKIHFPLKYAVFKDTGVMTYEITLIIEGYGDLFEKHGFGKTIRKQDLLKTEFIGILFERFENK